ncbi:hypothetical protein QNH20_07830 [Neobacillus sp. WH10]|uniref:hypothetical protein n=1 Tax=Neobacillus sp. WH10 TaxID=3047873 RepID=UPI0024C20348|nr:hypothetical protein [Neobacillus sp. WH10]WHY79028.1 hypothetical protein QNH20_07830 [Neobacillus sp. WH10]
MTYKVYYTNEANKRKADKREEFRIHTSNSKDSDDYTVYVNYKDVIKRDNSLYVIEGAMVRLFKE